MIISSQSCSDRGHFHLRSDQGFGEIPLDMDGGVIPAKEHQNRQKCPHQLSICGHNSSLASFYFLVFCFELCFKWCHPDRCEWSWVKLLMIGREVRTTVWMAHSKHFLPESPELFGSFWRHQIPAKRHHLSTKRLLNCPPAHFPNPLESLWLHASWK